MTITGLMRQDASVLIDGDPYEIVDHSRELIPTQPGDDMGEWELRIENWGLGWGHSQFTRPGTYDYATAANLHQPGRWRPGAAITQPSMGATPTGNTSFVEFWNGADAAVRRLIVVTARRVFEINGAGTITAVDLTSIVASTARMTKGVRFKDATMAVPKVYIAVQGNAATDDFIVRASAGSYAKNSGSLRAMAIGAGKDIDGEDILYRVDEDGRLNLSTAGTDPNLLAAWAAADYGIGEGSARANDIFQVGRQLLVGKEDGLWAWDLAFNSVPITRGMEQTPDIDNFTYLKERAGVVLAPTAQGIVWVEGLDWGVCGPVSSNNGARYLRGVEMAVTGSAGPVLYAAVYHGSTSYIFMGTDRREGDNGEGFYTWHGPVANIANKEITDLCVSTVTGDARLWIGWVGGFGYLLLEDDLTPKQDAPSGYIYLPDGIFDMEGAAIIKDFRKAEFIAPSARPFSATNQWTLELETSPNTYVPVDGGNVTSGVVASRFWTTPTSGQRLRGRLAYTGNAGAAELEAVVVRGTHRPEKTDVHTLVLRFKDGQRSRRGRQEWRSARDRVEALMGLKDSAAVTTVTYGKDSFLARVTSVKERVSRVGHTATPSREVELVLREVVLA